MYAMLLTAVLTTGVVTPETVRGMDPTSVVKKTDLAQVTMGDQWMERITDDTLTVEGLSVGAIPAHVMVKMAGLVEQTLDTATKPTKVDPVATHTLVIATGVFGITRSGPADDGVMTTGATDTRRVTGSTPGVT